MKQHEVEAWTESMFADLVVDTCDENEQLTAQLQKAIAALREIAALQTEEPNRADFANPFELWRAKGHYNAAQIARAALPDGGEQDASN